MPALPTPRAYESVLASIEADLRAGRLKIGDQLPGERALAEQHGISRASVRDAIRILDVMGVVRTSTGSGPNAGAVLVSEPAAGIGAALRLHVASASLSVEEIVQTRIVLETSAAQMMHDDERKIPLLAEARALLERMDDVGLRREDFHDLDARFHVVLASLSGNAVLTAMMESLRLAIRDYVSQAITAEVDWGDVSETLRCQHWGIFEAVAAGRGSEAAALLREHIEWFHREVV